MTRLVRFSNLAVSRLANSISTTSTTITLQTGDGAKFPSITGSQWFKATLVKTDGTSEVVKVTARSGDTLTVARAVEAVAGVQTAYSFSSGDRIEHRLTAGDLAGELDRLDAAAYISVLNKDADYTVTTENITSLIRVDTSSDNVAITLPDISTLTDDFDVIVAKVTDDTNAVTIKCSSTDTVNGTTTYTLGNPWQGAWLTADRSTGTWTVISSSGAGGTRPIVDTFTGAGTAGPFTLSSDPGSKENTMVYVGSVYQQKASYTLSGTSLTLGGAVASGVPVEVISAPVLPVGSTTADMVWYTPYGVGAKTRKAREKIGESVSVWDFMTDAMKADVIAGTALVDCLPAFDAAIASFPSTLDNWAYYAGRTITTPFGAYYLSDTLVIDRCVLLVGEGSASGNAPPGAQLLFQDGKTGVRVRYLTETGTGKGGFGAGLKNILLSRKGNLGASTGHGIHATTCIRIENVKITWFREHGIYIDAYAPETNANGWSIKNTQVFQSGKCGIFINGPDANAGYCSKVTCSNNGEWGIYDSSFLGNTYIACDGEGNTLGQYKTDDPNARNVFVGCYSEGGQPKSSFRNPTLIIGGLHGAGFDGGQYIGDGRFTSMESELASNAAKIQIGAGVNSDSSAVLNLLDTVHGFPYSIRWQTGAWSLGWSTTDKHMMMYTQGATPANGYARDLSSWHGKLGFPNGFLFGEQMKLWLSASTAPTTSSYYKRGDVVYNNQPSAGGVIGWSCVSDSVSTLGTINASSSSLSVVSGTGIANGDSISIAGAGRYNDTLVTSVVSGGGTTTITLADSAFFSVSGASVTTPGTWKTFGAISA